jgi:hypothetical protein
MLPGSSLTGFNTRLLVCFFIRRPVK